MSREGIHQQSAVLDSRGEGADLIERGGKGNKTVAGDTPVGWFEPHATAERSGLANGPPCIGAKGGKSGSGSHGGSRPPA